MADAILPRICAACTSTIDVERHHLYSVKDDCPDDLQIWLCRICHTRTHNFRAGDNLNHYALTMRGLALAKAAGRVGGNPGLRARDPNAIRKVREGRDAAHMERVLATLDTWLPTVRRLRPAQSWGHVVLVLNRTGKPTWTVERLRRTVTRLVAEGLAEKALLDRAPAPRHLRGYDAVRLMRLISGIQAAAPDRTLQQIASGLEAMGERTPRGGTRWHPSSVKHLLVKADQMLTAP